MRKGKLVLVLFALLTLGWLVKPLRERLCGWLEQHYFGG